jgi:hypothetical protein
VAHEILFHQEKDTYTCPGCMKSPTKNRCPDHSKCSYALKKLLEKLDIITPSEWKVFMNDERLELFHSILPFGDVHISLADYKSMFPKQFVEQGAVFIRLHMVFNDSVGKVKIMNPTFYKSYDIDDKHVNWNKMIGSDKEKRAANAGSLFSGKFFCCYFYFLLKTSFLKIQIHSKAIICSYQLLKIFIGCLQLCWLKSEQYC